MLASSTWPHILVKSHAGTFTFLWLAQKQELARKVVALMQLSHEQLSKRDHYDYGLRSFIVPIIRAAGTHWQTHIKPLKSL